MKQKVRQISKSNIISTQQAKFQHKIVVPQSQIHRVGIFTQPRKTSHNLWSLKFGLEWQQERHSNENIGIIWIQDDLSYLTGCGDVSQSAPGLQLNSASNEACFIRQNFVVWQRSSICILNQCILSFQIFIYKILHNWHKSWVIRLLFLISLISFLLRKTKMSLNIWFLIN